MEGSRRDAGQSARIACDSGDPDKCTLDGRKCSQWDKDQHYQEPGCPTDVSNGWADMIP